MDPYQIPLPGQPIPKSATLINSMLEAARESSNRDSLALPDASFNTDHYPFRIIFIRNTTTQQIWHDWPVAIGKPTGLSDSDFINGQPVFPMVSSTEGWATFARPLKRLPPGCAGPALLLGWLGPNRVSGTGAFAYSWRRTQPQRAYGGTAIVGVPYVQATAQNFPRSKTAWRSTGIVYGFDQYPGMPERVPQMESLKTYLHYDQSVFLNFAHKTDLHGWWCPVIEVRRTQYAAQFTNQTYYFPPTNRRLRMTQGLGYGDTFSGNVDVSFDPILWNPAVVSFNPAYGANNFNRDPFVSSSGSFNKNGGLMPLEMTCLQTASVNWSTKGKRSGGTEVLGMCNSPQLYGYKEFIDMDGGTWNYVSVFQDSRYAIGPEVIHFFETDRDDSIDAQGNTIVPGIGSGSTPGPGTGGGSGTSPPSGGSGTIGPSIFGQISGVTLKNPIRVVHPELIRRVDGLGYGSSTGIGAPSPSSSSVSGSGTTGTGIE